MDKSKDHRDSARRVVIIEKVFSQRRRWLGKKRRVFNRSRTYSLLAPVVQTVDSAIHWIIHHYSVDNGIGFPPTSPLDSYLWPRLFKGWITLSTKAELFKAELR